jgi:hypothetical protein
MMDKAEREKLREVHKGCRNETCKSIIALLDHIDALERQVEELKNPPKVKSGMYLCNTHGGYGFTSDCAACNGELVGKDDRSRF